MEVLRKKIRFRVIFVIDVFLLLFVQVLQGASLNYYFIKQFEEYFTTYFLFILDFLCSCVFGGTFYLSYVHFTRPGKHIQSSSSSSSLGVRRNFTSSVKKSFPESTYGVLPLSYVSWLIYVAVLISKLSIIFGTDIVFHLASDYPSHAYTSQIFQVSVALSSIVFMLLVEGHNWHKKSSECYSYVTAVCKKTGIEIFDSVEMLQFVITTDHLWKPIENAVFVLATVNFVLPALSLYALSISDFGRNVTRRCLPLRIIHSVARLLLIDIPFFAVRLHVLIVNKQISAFMMKNLFYILLAVRELYLDVFMYCKPAVDKSSRKSSPPKHEEIPLSNEQTQTDADGNVENENTRKFDLDS